MKKGTIKWNSDQEKKTPLDQPPKGLFPRIRFYIYEDHVSDKVPAGYVSNILHTHLVMTTKLKSVTKIMFQGVLSKFLFYPSTANSLKYIVYCIRFRYCIPLFFSKGHVCIYITTVPRCSRERIIFFTKKEKIYEAII